MNLTSDLFQFEGRSKESNQINDEYDYNGINFRSF